MIMHLPAGGARLRFFPHGEQRHSNVFAVYK
jgi:hypothetical protein